MLSSRQSQAKVKCFPFIGRCSEQLAGLFSLLTGLLDLAFMLIFICAFKLVALLVHRAEVPEIDLADIEPA